MYGIPVYIPDTTMYNQLWNSQLVYTKCTIGGCCKVLELQLHARSDHSKMEWHLCLLEAKLVVLLHNVSRSQQKFTSLWVIMTVGTNPGASPRAIPPTTVMEAL